MQAVIARRVRVLWSWHVQKPLFCPGPSWLLALRIFLLLLCDVPWALGGWVRSRCPSHDWHLFSALWPIESFCVDHQLLHAEAALAEVRAALICGCGNAHLEDSSILCPLSKVIVAGLHLCLHPCCGFSVRFTVPGKCFLYGTVFLNPNRSNWLLP